MNITFNANEYCKKGKEKKEKKSAFIKKFSLVHNDN